LQLAEAARQLEGPSPARDADHANVLPFIGEGLIRKLQRAVDRAGHELLQRVVG